MLFQIQRKNAFSYDTTFGDICQIFDKECGHDRGREFLGIGVLVIIAGVIMIAGGDTEEC